MSPHQPYIVWQGHQIIAVCKPFGMPSQDDPSGDLSILGWTQEQLGCELHLLHRLDRPTGGLILLSSSKKAAASLNRQFESREVKKVYLGVTEGVPSERAATLSHHIAKLPGKNFVRAYDKKVRHSKPAVLRYEVAQTSGDFSLLEIHPETGRRHQIRAQLRTVKLPLVGDQKYGKGKPLPYPGIALWAYKITFCDPSGQKQTLSAPPPDDEPWNLFDF